MAGFEVVGVGLFGVAEHVVEDAAVAVGGPVVGV